MTTVDLDRLQVALSDWVDDRLGIAGGSDTLERCALAVLDAPTEYRCNWSFTQPTEGCDSGEHQMAGRVEGGRCGWVALVPVSGGEG